MKDPYRSTDVPTCPACAEPLREFEGRLCCDACTGVLVSVADLENVLTEQIASQTGTAAVPGFVDGKPSKRVCPRCRTPMTITHLDVKLGEKHRRLAPTLDRCASHGVWFDANELAEVLEALQHAAELPSHASLRQIVVTIFENYGHRYTMRKWRPLD